MKKMRNYLIENHFKNDMTKEYQNYFYSDNQELQLLFEKYPTKKIEKINIRCLPGIQDFSTCESIFTMKCQNEKELIENYRKKRNFLK